MRLSHLKSLFFLMLCATALACNGLGVNECLDAGGNIGTLQADGKTCVVNGNGGGGGGGNQQCTTNCTTQRQVTLTATGLVGNEVLHVWDGSHYTVQAGQSITVNACAWSPPANNQGASGKGIAFWVQSAPGSSAYRGCDNTPGSVNQITVTGNGRSVNPTAYADQSACHGSGQLVNGFVSSGGLNISCG